jgi:folate-binding protein YgfZ
MAIPLCAAEVLVIAGADALTFAHAQFSSDVKALAVNHWQWSAWLDPQGRVRFFFALLHVESDRFIAWLPLGGAQPMCDALSRFVMRSALTLDTRLDWVLHQLDKSELDATLSTSQVVARARGFAFTQPGALPRIAWIAPGDRGERRVAIKTDRAALNHWRLGDIDAGLPLLAPSLSGEFVPQALDLERFDAIRFDKGCYPGQEIAARLHFRGGNKRHLQRLRIDGVAPADPVSIIGDHDKVLGHVLHAANTSTTTSEAIGVLADAHSEAARLLTTTGLDVAVIAPE